jgi:hypothetical protein
MLNPFPHDNKITNDNTLFAPKNISFAPHTIFHLRQNETLHFSQ